VPPIHPSTAAAAMMVVVVMVQAKVRRRRGVHWQRQLALRPRKIHLQWRTHSRSFQKLPELAAIADTAARISKSKTK
jgi:hypothetical protein